MATSTVTPPLPLPPNASTGVEPVRRGGADRRQARDERRRRGGTPAAADDAVEPEAVRPPAGRLDVVA